MTNRSLQESEFHNQLIIMMANYFQREGYQNIKADIPGYEQPEILQGQIRNHQPDLTCNDTCGNFIILESETCSTIFNSHTQSQWQLFAAYANYPNTQFHLVVPNDCNGQDGRKLARDQLLELGLKYDKIWTPTKQKVSY